MRTQAGFAVLLMGIAVGSRAQTVATDSTEAFDFGSLGSGGGRWMDQVLSAVPGGWSFGWKETPWGANRWTIGRSDGTGFGQTGIMLDGRPFRDPVTGEPDLAEIPASAVESIALSRTNDSDGSSPIGGTLRIGTASIPSHSPLTRMVYRNGGGKTDFGVLFGHRSPNCWEMKSALDDQSFDGDGKRRMIRSNITIRPGGPFELRYALRTGKNEFPSTAFQSAGSWYSAGRLRSDRIDHGVSVLTRFLAFDARINFDRTRMDYRTDEPDSRASGKATSVGLRVEKVDSILTLTGGVESFWRSLELADTFGNDRLMSVWSRADWKTGPNRFRLGVIGKWMENNRRGLCLNGRFDHRIAGGTSLWAAWTEGLREPLLAELMGKPFGRPGVGIKPNPGLTFEKGRRLELGADKTENGKRLGLNLFVQNTYKTIAGIDDQMPQSSFTNGGENPFWGVTALVGMNIRDAGFVLTATNITYDRLNPSQWWGRIAGYAGHSFFQDDLQMKLSLAVRFWGDDWKLNNETLFVKSSAILDAKLSALVMNDFSFEFGVEDVFDSKVPVIFSEYQPGRRMWTGIIWNLYD